MIYIKNLSKTYEGAEVSVQALKDVSLVLPTRGMVFVVGKSGSGKSTMLNMLGALDMPTSGEIWFDGLKMHSETLDADTLRAQMISFIFQDFNLNASLNVAENVGMPLRLLGKPVSQAAVDGALREVGLVNYGEKRISQLSGGEQQRVAIARAIVNAPEVILADEPTGNLDSFNGENIFEILKELSQDRLIVVVSHDRPSAEKYGDRIIELADGEVFSDTAKGEVLELIKGDKAYSGKDGGKDKNVETGDKKVDQNEGLDAETNASSGDIVKDADIAEEESVTETKDTEAENIAEASGILEGFEAVERYVPTADFPVPTEKTYEKTPPLTFKNALFFAGKNLLSRKSRTILTIVICVLSFAIFGLSYIISTYSVGVANSKTFLNNHNERDIVVYKSGEKGVDFRGIQESGGPLTTENAKEIRKMFPDSYLPVYNLNGFNVSAKNMDFSGVYMFDIYGAYELSQDMLGKLPYPLKDFSNGAKSRFPTSGKPISGLNVCEVAITDFLALIIYRELKGVPADSEESFKAFVRTEFEAELLNTVYDFGVSKLRIVGILDTGYKDKYLDEFLEGYADSRFEYSELNYMVQNFYCMLYTGVGFAESVYTTAHITKDVHFVTATNPTFMFYTNNDAGNHITYANGYSFTGVLFANELILTENYFRIVFREEFDPAKKYVVETELELADFSGYKVVGVIDNATGLNKFSTDFGAVVPSAGLKAVSTAQAYLMGARVVLTNRTASKLFQYMYDNQLFAKSIYAQAAYVSNASMISMKNVFLPIAIILGIVAVASLAMFLVSSVTKKQKDIGVMKAMGVKTGGVTMIYLIESVIVLLMVMILSSVLLTVLFEILSSVIVSQFSATWGEFFVENTVLVYLSAAPYLVSIAAILVVGTLASIYPVRKIALMQPIDAIKKV